MTKLDLLRGVRCAVAALMLAVLAACGGNTQDSSAYYRVRSGDTLSAIAQAQGASVDDLVRWNRLRNANQIHPGMLLRVKPPGDEQAGGGPNRSGTGGNKQPVAKKPSAQPAARAASSEAPVTGIALIWPAQGKLIKTYDGAGSRGLTIANTEGTPVLAAAAGTVAYANNGLRGYGNMIIVRHAGGFLSIYAHNSKLLVKEGQTVKQGQRIADMGGSDAGVSALYFELRRGDQPVNPLGVLPQR